LEWRKGGHQFFLFYIANRNLIKTWISTKHSGQKRILGKKSKRQKTEIHSGHEEKRFKYTLGGGLYKKQITPG